LTPQPLHRLDIYDRHLMAKDAPEGGIHFNIKTTMRLVCREFF
jgi:hypothetical protein